MTWRDLRWSNLTRYGRIGVCCYVGGVLTFFSTWPIAAYRLLSLEHTLFLMLTGMGLSLFGMQRLVQKSRGVLLDNPQAYRKQGT